MRVRSSRFVGRGDELARLGRWLDEAHEGQPRVVIVGGEAGVGKSRLVGELGRLAQERGVGWLMGASADFGAGGLPFEALVSALRPLVSDERLIARLGPARAELAALFPSLGGARASSATDGLSNLRLHEALLGLLEQVARESPAVLVLEDLHWADASTRDFLSFLARNLGSLPLLVMVTFRSDDVGRGHPLRRYLAELGRVSGVERLDLSRLGREDLRELAEAIRGEPVDEVLLRQLYERSQGNPYFSEELLAAAQSSHIEEALPASLREILLARVEVLAPHARTVLAATSVLATANEGLLGTVTGLSAQDLSQALREAIDRSILEETGPAHGADAYAFRHALAREVVYADLLPGERARLHERVAQALSADADADAAAGDSADPQNLARLAHHWRQSGRPLEAFLASWRAAEAAERAHANAEAALHFEHVLELWDQVEGPEQLLGADRTDVLLRAGSAAHLANDQARASALLRSAVDRIDAQLEPDRAAQVRQVLLRSLVMGGMTDAAQEVKDQLDELAAACSPATRLHVLTNFMWYFEHYGNLAQSLELSGEALALAESVGDERDRALLHSRAGRSRAFLEGAEAGLAELELARSIATAAGDDEVVGGIEKDIGIVLQSAGRFTEAIEAFERSQRLLEPLGVRNTSRHTDAEIGFALHRLGRWREADAAMARSLTPPVTEWSYAVRAYVLAATGRLQEARRELRRAWPSVEVSQASTSYGPYFVAQAIVGIWEGRPAEAVDAAEAGLGLVKSTGNHRAISELCAIGVRAAADIGGSARQRAEDLLAYLRKRAREALSEGTIFEVEVRAWLATAEAEMSRLGGKSEARLWAGAVAAWRETGRPHELAYALYRQAEAILSSGDERAKAREYLPEAWQLASAAGAALLLAAIEGLARRARLEVGQAPADAASGDYGLTAREREVLALVAGGRTDQQIAEALFISPKTASVHVSNIKAKLGVEHRIEAAAVGAGLVATEDA